jgi:glycerate-2-kinase
MQPSEPKGPAVEDPCEFKNMLAGIMVAIQQNNNKLQESVRADLAANQESIKAEINSIRNDIKAENGKLIKRFELQSQEAKKEFTTKLDSEARRVTNLVGQVRKEIEAELLAVKEQIKVRGAFNSKVSDFFLRTGSR